MRSFNIDIMLADEAEEGYVTIYYINHKYKTYDEAVRLNIEFMDTRSIETLSINPDAKNEDFKLAAILSCLPSDIKKLRLVGREEDYVFVIKTESRIQILNLRDYDPEKDDTCPERRFLESILGCRPSKVWEKRLNLPNPMRLSIS